MRYERRSGADSLGSYDACHYLISSDGDKPAKILINFLKSTEMNVYIYEGDSRTNATNSIIYHNKSPKLATPYGVDVSSGILVVAYPNENAVTEFEFEYYTGIVDDEDYNYNNTILVLAILIGAAVVASVLCLFCQKDDPVVPRKEIYKGD
jgi:hypothetical protein